MKAIREQHDDMQNQLSDQAATFCTTEEDKTRQEFKQDADVNTTLLRHGLPVAGLKTPVYTDNNTDIDLQDAIQIVETVRTAHADLPEHIRARYPTWQHLLTAAMSNTLDFQKPRTYTKDTVPPLTPEEITTWRNTVPQPSRQAQDTSGAAPAAGPASQPPPSSSLPAR